MKPFAFSLQTVLDVRRLREDRLRAELADLCQQEQRQEVRVDELRRQHLAIHERMVTAPTVLSGAEVLAAAAVGEGLVAAIHGAEQEREKLAQAREAKTEETHAAACARKVLETLRAQAFGRHQAEVAAQVERQLDDLCARSVLARPRAGEASP